MLVDAIEREGVLLLQDARLPSAATLIAGEPVKGSWWGHAKGSAIYDAVEAATDHPDVESFKLFDGKVCFVHRRLWPAVIAVGRAREPWQLEGLDEGAAALLAAIDREGRVRASGKPAKAIELRLLAASVQVHTESGRHATELERWDAFARRRGLRMGRTSARTARASLEALRDEWAGRFGHRARLPWGC